MAAPHPAAAQGSCTSTPTISGTSPYNLSGIYTAQVKCSGLTGGLTLTFGSGAKIGTTASPIGENSLDVDAAGTSNNPGANPVKVSGVVEIHSDKFGLYLDREGTGILDIGLSKGTVINAGLSATGEVSGVYAKHRGEANTALTDGIKIVSEADITVSKPTGTSRFYGIYAETTNSKAGTTIPITIEVNGGTIKASDARDNQESRGVSVNQYAKGNVKITVADESKIGTVEKHVSHSGIFVRSLDKADGDIEIEHAGHIYADTGIFAESLPEVDNAAGNIMITTVEGSTIVAKKVSEQRSVYEMGIFAAICNRDDNCTSRGGVGQGSSSGNITVIHNGSIDAAGDGLHLDNKGTGDITITTGANSKIVSKKRGIYAPGKGNFVITHGGSIEAGARGIYLDPNGSGGVTIETKKGSTIKAGSIGVVAEIKAGESGLLQLTHGGSVDSKEEGLDLSHRGSGGLTVKTQVGSKIKAGRYGVYARISTGGSGLLKVTHGGEIESTTTGLYAHHFGTAGNVEVTTEKGSKIKSAGESSYPDGEPGLSAAVRGTANTAGTLMVYHQGEITAGHEGIYATHRVTDGTGKITVKTAPGSKIVAALQGLRLRHDGTTGTFDVQVRGTIQGGNAADDGTKYAGIHIQTLDDDTTVGGGGTIVIGPRAHVHAQSGDAMRVDSFAGPVKIILEKDSDGFVGRVEGKIWSPAKETTTNRVTTSTKAELSFFTRVGMDGDETPDDPTTATGARSVVPAADETGLTPDDPTTGVVYRREAGEGIYDKVIKLQLKTIPEGYEFEDDTTVDLRLYQDRARVYEALPAVLLDLNGQLPYQERMAAPRTGNGLWARLAAGDGARRPARSTTAQGFRGRALAWDVSQYGFEGGLDFRPAATERLLLGVSLHARQGTATVAHGGTIEVSGFGGGVSATYRDAAGVYLDGRFSYTYFDDVDLTSRTRGMVQADLSGHGYALGLEAGKRLGWEGLDHVALTPRARVVWSTVELEDFADLAGSGRVALETATSLKGRLGLLTETAFGGATIEDWAGDGGRLFASLDVEHEFAADREIQASGTALASEVRATWGRVGLGGALIWTEGLTLSGEGFYATAGSDNTDFGGSLTLTLRF